MLKGPQTRSGERSLWRNLQAADVDTLKAQTLG
jgi:hypothetical protein